MTKVLQVRERTLAPSEIIPLLTSYKLLPQFFREIIIDSAIASIDCTAEEIASACQQFKQRHQIASETDLKARLARYGMLPDQLAALATRDLKIEKFKQANWGQKIESYFLTRKPQLDKVIYSLLRTKDVGLAEELYFRIQEGEQSFAECAQAYSQGPEALMGGMLGPIELGMVHPTVAHMLSISQKNQLLPPIRLEEWIVIVRLEKLLPAQLDESKRQQLLNELFEAWLSKQMHEGNLQLLCL